MYVTDGWCGPRRPHNLYRVLACALFFAAPAASAQTSMVQKLSPLMGSSVVGTCTYVPCTPSIPGGGMHCGVMAMINCGPYWPPPYASDCGSNTSAVNMSVNATCRPGGLPMGATFVASGSAAGSPASCMFLFNRICDSVGCPNVPPTTVRHRRSLYCTVDQNTLGGGSGPGLPVELTEFSVESESEE